MSTTSPDATHFNPRTPCGVRLCHYDNIRLPNNFNPRTPCGVRLTQPIPLCSHAAQFQSTHPMRGATKRYIQGLWVLAISIHAPHAGCDAFLRMPAALHQISIHAPHAGCDLKYIIDNHACLPISIHAPHAGCDMQRKAHGVEQWISIHAPHAGCDINHAGRWLHRLISIHAPHAGCDSRGSV